MVQVEQMKQLSWFIKEQKKRNNVKVQICNVHVIVDIGRLPASSSKGIVPNNQ